MRRILSLLFLFPLLLAAQNASQPDTGQVVSRYSNGSVNESYRLNAAGNKEGVYVRYSRYGKKFVSGQYENGKPSGIWEFYSSDTLGKLVQKLDFTNHKELYVDSLRVPSLICGPRYFGGNMIKQEYIQQSIKNRFTETERAMLKGQSFTVVFTIDEKTLKPIGVNCDDNALPDDTRRKLEQIVTDMPAWLPPVCKNSSEVWRFSVVFVF